MVQTLQQKLPPESVLVVQSDEKFDAAMLPDADRWDIRHYGRTQLAIWTKAGIRDEGLGTRNQQESARNQTDDSLITNTDP
jgi:hypothetical protein